MQKTKQTPQDFQTVESQHDSAPTQAEAPASGPQRGPLGEAPSKLPVVGIGASAGGLAALKLLLPQIPPDSGVAFVLVVHLSPDFKSQLAELLQPRAQLTVQQVVDDVPLEPNHIYVIPPNRNLNTIDSHLRLSPLEKQRRERAPIDHFFRTLAKTHNGNSVGIILTGTGADGTLGVQEIKAQGGLTIAQDPAQAEYDGMPRSAVATGMIDFVLPLEAMVERALRFLHTRPRVPIVDEPDLTPTPRLFLPRVFALVRARTGNEFGHYKQSTILRRIRRRMQLAHVEELEEYLAILRSQPEEVQALAEDFLITVTNFFRDTAVFDYIEREVVHQLFAHKSASDTVRVWSVGCSTGEEAYSLAMLLLEQASRQEGAPEIQIFASDLHERSLGKARQGVYPEDIETDVSSERLKRFFIKESGCYRLRKEVRDLVVFAPHNVLSDPPFSRIDLILCRNVLIYLQRDVQSDIIDLFHYALNPNGWLVVGTAESVEGTEQFVAQSKKQGCYRKRNVPQAEPRLPVFPLVRGVANAKEPVEPRASLTTYGAMHQRMVERFAPPSILVSPDCRVVHFSQNAGRYMLQPGGTPTTNVFKLVREELHLELRAALQATKDGGHAYTSKPVAVKLDGKCRHVSLYARQNQGAESALPPGLSEIDEQGQGQPHQEEEEHELKGFILVTFDERDEASQLGQAPSAASPSDQAVRGLSSELEFTKQRLQSVVEEYETSQEEMRAANEELQSANEELRSTLEELETSKEELQSINEELQTANEENRHRVAELSQISSDLQHLMAATHIATLFLDRELRILRFTPQVGELFSLRPVDTGRPLSDLTHRLGYDELIADATNVLAQLTTIEREVQDYGGHWYLARLRPYLSADDRVDGVVLTFVDITSRKHSEEALQLSKERYRRLFESMDEGFCVVDVRTPAAGGKTEYRVLETNPAFNHQTGLVNVLGTDLKQSSPSLLTLCQEAFERLSATAEPVRFECAATERDSWFDVYAFKLSDAEGVRMAMLLRNVGERRKAEEALRLASERDAFRLTLSDALRELDDASEIEAACCRALAPHLDVNLVFYGEVSEDGTLAILAEHGTGIEPLPRSLPLQELFGQSRVEQLRAGRTLSASDVLSPSPNTPGRMATGLFDLRAYVAVPLLRNGRLAAVLLVHQNQPRVWSDAEVSIIEEAADRTWTAAERARAERAVRTSAAALREADSRKDEFLAMLSHELRNPLAPIMNGLYLLEHTPPGSEQASTAQAVMRRQVAQLARLVDDLLDLTRIARGKIQLKGERMDLNNLVQRTVDDYRSLFQKNEISLEFEPASGAVPVNGDANRLAQAVGDLLQNCAKFTSRGGHTQVSVRVDDESSTAEIRIVDSGVGMTAEVLSRLFQPFMQGETTIDRSQGGLGLGLALTKRLVELHGGAISAHSEGPGKGTAFVVSLPIERGGAGQTEPPRSTAEWHRRRVLIIEDSVDAADTLKAALEFSSHEVAVAYDGAHGLTKAREFQPEVVLCDLGLPGIDGYQVAQAFRADPLLSGTYMIALSGYAMPEDRQRAHTAGFNRHLAKPPDLEQLEDLLSKVRLPAVKSER